MEQITRNKTIYELITRQKSIFIDLTLMIFSVFILAALANIRIPLWPVPITFQTLGIFLIAFFFGSRKGTLTVLLYLIAGLIGFGVFAGYKSGIAALMGPTGGYLIGFIFTVFFIGYLIEKGYGKSRKSILICMVLGSLIIYTFGLIGLFVLFGNIGIINLLMIGVIPFLVGDILKIIIAVSLFPYIWDKSNKVYSRRFD